jgi:hypothetical protein
VPAGCTQKDLFARSGTAWICPACLLWEAGGEEQVREMWATFPFAQAGMNEMLLVPLQPYAGFRPTKPPKVGT